MGLPKWISSRVHPKSHNELTCICDSCILTNVDTCFKYKFWLKHNLSLLGGSSVSGPFPSWSSFSNVVTWCHGTCLVTCLLIWHCDLSKNLRPNVKYILMLSKLVERKTFFFFLVRKKTILFPPGDLFTTGPSIKLHLVMSVSVLINF